MIIKLADWFLRFLPYFNLLIAASLAFGLIKFKSFRIAKLAVLVFIISGFFGSLVKTIGTWILWKNDPFSRFLLPPYQKIAYFISYSGYRFWFSFLFSFLIGWFLFFLIKKAIFADCAFFQKDEGFLVWAGCLICGHPLWLVFLFSTVFLGLIVSIFNRKFLKNDKDWRIGLYYFWLPMAFLISLNSFWILRLDFLRSLQF